MKRRILAMVLALVMAFALLTVASAADVKTAVELNKAVAAGGEVKLTDDITASITIPAGTAVTLDLNGYTLTNEAGKDTITVANGAKLVITGNGTVDNVSHGMAAVFNNGTTTLNGGTYTRSKETGDVSTGKNSYYNIVNHGDMTINAGVTVEQDGNFSSMIENGYYSFTSNNERSGYVPGTNMENPKMTINGGLFMGGLNTIKNDDNGVLEINGGTFKNVTQAAVLNWNVAEINDGSFEVKAGANAVVLNGSYGASSNDKGELTINGGEFTATGSTPVIKQMDSGLSIGTVEITDGTFSSGANAEMIEVVAKKDADVIEVSGGNFSSSMKDTGYLTNATDVELKKADGTYSYFDSVGKAVAAAEDGDEVVILDKNAGATYCTVTLVTSEFGETPASSTFEAEKGDTVILPALADKSGHEFAGWYTDILAGEPVGTLTANKDGYEYVVTGNVTLYARWAYDGGIIVPIIPTIGTSSFTDVPGSAYYKTAVDWAVSKGIASGTSAKTFSPDAACTRGQAVTFIWRAAGSPAPKSTVNPFKDVKATDYCYDAVLWAVEQGITNGTTATTFSPDKACTRGEIVTLLYRASGSPAGYAANSGYVDVSAKSYCATAVSWAVALRITTGTSINTFRPDAACTRAQIVTFLYRAAR